MSKSKVVLNRGELNHNTEQEYIDNIPNTGYIGMFKCWIKGHEYEISPNRMINCGI